MKSFETSNTIDAAPERVRGVLADTSSWPDWDSGVVRVEGELEQGSRIKVVSELNPKRAYQVTVAELDPGRGMTWRGGMPLGLFRGVRTYGSRRTATGARASRCARSSAGRWRR